MIKQRTLFVADGPSTHVSPTANHPLADRLGVFRQMAAEARRDAAHAASSEARLDYDRLARSWDELIYEIVAAMDANER